MNENYSSGGAADEDTDEQIDAAIDRVVSSASLRVVRGGGYENAPATRMLATHCAVCGRALVDSVSVDFGIGPDCRRKYGFNQVVSEEARREANKIVHDIALEQTGLEVARRTVRLRELGFDKLAAIVEKRVCHVQIRIGQDGRLEVKAPYDERALADFRTVRGRRWDGERKLNTFPVESKREVFAALVRCYFGKIALGPRGVFKIGDES